jgi:hypothetical protein
VDIPESDWMKIPLKEDYIIPAKSVRVYPLGVEGHAVVDKLFDELHAQGRLHYTTRNTPSSLPVFVI